MLELNAECLRAVYEMNYEITKVSFKKIGTNRYTYQREFLEIKNVIVKIKTMEGSGYSHD